MNQTRDACAKILRRRLRTERTIFIAEQLLVLRLEDEVAEGALIEPAIAGGQKVITNLLNDTNGVRLRPEDMTLTVIISFVAGFSLTCEAGAGLNSSRVWHLLIRVTKEK